MPFIFTCQAPVLPLLLVQGIHVARDKYYLIKAEDILGTVEYMTPFSSEHLLIFNLLSMAIDPFTT
jgi:hypothetical protein